MTKTEEEERRSARTMSTGCKTHRWAQAGPCCIAVAAAVASAEGYVPAEVADTAVAAAEGLQDTTADDARHMDPGDNGSCWDPL